jgi:hypothetical protein
MLADACGREGKERRDESRRCTQECVRHGDSREVD